MKGIRDTCPNCREEMLRFEEASSVQMRCPSCRAPLRVTARGLKRAGAHGKSEVLATPREALVRPVGLGADEAKSEARAVAPEPPRPSGLPPVVPPKPPKWILASIVVPVMSVLVAVILWRAMLPNQWSRPPSSQERGASEGKTGIEVAARKGDAVADRATAVSDKVPDKVRKEAKTNAVSKSISIPASLADVVEKISPAVVAISQSGDNGRGLGSGFVSHVRKWVVTNHHVVAGARRAVAVRKDETGEPVVQREVVGFVACDPATDLVILELREGWPSDAVQLATRKVRSGTEVFAIGSPEGLINSVTKGIVSAVRSAGEVTEHLRGSTAILQTDAMIAPGSSGGPLCDMQGRVVGINTFGCKIGETEFMFAIAVEELGRLLQHTSSRAKPLSELPDRVEEGTP